MSQALEGTSDHGQTLTEQANGQRIGRAMFIGHSVGWVIILALISIALIMFGFRAELRPSDLFGPAQPGMNVVIFVPTPWASMALSVVAALIWTDLGVRRRHDRNRSGVDVVVYQLLAVASVIIHLFADAADIVGWLDLFLAAYALYLFVVLVLLPGNRGENRYGPVPRPD